MSERGFALTELLVAVGVGLVVVFAAFAALDRSVAGSAEVDDRLESAQRARLAMEHITRQLRSQVCADATRPPIVEARADSVTFYAHLGDESFQPDMRRLSYADGTLVQDVFVGSGSGLDRTFAAEPLSRALVTNVLPPPGGAIFRYYAFGGADASRPAGQELVPGATGLSGAERARVVRIEVGFVARPTLRPGDASRRTTLQNEVFARTADPLTPGAGPRCI